MYAYKVLDAIAIGVSGGADSMALLHMLKSWADTHKITLTALTVDHGLRPEAADEAAYVARICRDWGIAHHTLKPDTPLDNTRLQENARNMRYDLMTDFCKKHNISCIALAHHLDDQYETFLMRLARGSGLKGLNGMRTAYDKNGITLVRPLLNIPKAGLIAYCINHQIEWCEDPSNDNTQYDRVRVRDQTPVLYDLGLTPDMIEKTRAKLAAAQGFIDDMLAPLFDRAMGISHFEMDMDEFNALHPYLCEKLVEQALMTVSENIYPPRHNALQRLIEDMRGKKFKGATLHNCLISQKRGHIIIEPEL